jgi:hypothetical protein
VVSSRNHCDEHSGSIKAAKFLTSCATVSLSRRNYVVTVTPHSDNSADSGTGSWKTRLMCIVGQKVETRCNDMLAE